MVCVMVVLCPSTSVGSGQIIMTFWHSCCSSFFETCNWLLLPSFFPRAGWKDGWCTLRVMIYFLFVVVILSIFNNRAILARNFCVSFIVGVRDCAMGAVFSLILWHWRMASVSLFFIWELHCFFSLVLATVTKLMNHAKLTMSPGWIKTASPLLL